MTIPYESLGNLSDFHQGERLIALNSLVGSPMFGWVKNHQRSVFHWVFPWDISIEAISDKE